MRRFIFSIAVLLSCTAYAQTDTLRAVVNVHNEYNPVHIKVNKKSFVPTTTGSETRKSSPSYEFTREAMPFGGFVSERSTKELLKGQETPYHGYARAGYGTDNGLDLKAAYRRDITARDNINAVASVDGYKSELDGVFNEWESRMYRSMASLGYTHLFDYLKLSAGADFCNRVFNYQNAGFMQSMTDKQNSMSYGAHIGGESRLAGAFGYDFNAAFTHNSRKYTTGEENSIYENRISAGGNVWYDINSGGVSKVGMLASADFFLYNNTLRNAAHPYDNYCSIDIDPYIGFLIKGWRVRIGTRMNIVTANSAAFAIAPDIVVEKELGNVVSLYAKATGGRTDNSFARMESITPYWNFDAENSIQLKPTYKVFDATAGTRVTFGAVSADFEAGYAYTKDDLLQCFNHDDRYSKIGFVCSNFAQDDTHNAHATLRAGYDLGGWMKVAADARYDYWKCDSKELLMMKPQVTCNINTEFKPVRGLTLNADYNFTYFAKSPNGRISNKSELSMRASYDIFPWLGVYIQGENLLGDRYFEYAGYETRGARGLFGVTANF